MKPSRNVPGTFKPLTFTLDWCSSESIRHNPPQLEGFFVQEHGAGIFFSLNLVYFAIQKGLIRVLMAGNARNAEEKPFLSGLYFFNNCMKHHRRETDCYSNPSDRYSFSTV